MSRVKIVRMGNCNKCGDCCKDELLPARIKVYEAAGIPYKLVNQNCDKFDSKTGLCKDYDNRPQNCKDFPVACGLISSAALQLLLHCLYMNFC